MNCPPGAGRKTRSDAVPPELPALTEKLVTVPSKGTCSSGLEIEEKGRKVHVLKHVLMFVVGVPVTLPSVTVWLAVWLARGR